MAASAVIVIAVLTVVLRQGRKESAVPPVEPIKAPSVAVQMPNKANPETSVPEKTVPNPPPVVPAPPSPPISATKEKPRTLAQQEKSKTQAPVNVSEKPPESGKRVRGIGYDDHHSFKENKIAAPKAKPLGPVEITLPSGAALTEAMLNVPEHWQKTLFPKKMQPYIARYADGSIQGVFALNSKGKLDGAAATLHENGHLQTLAGYSRGNLDGRLRQWDKRGKRVFYAEYRNGGKRGVLCLFQEGAPWLIQEYDFGKCKNEYLVKLTQDGSGLLSADELSAGEIEEMSGARRQLSALEDTMQRSEAKLKAELLRRYRDYEEKIRKQRQTGSAADRRAAASDRIKSHNAERSAAMESNWRCALGRSGF